MKGRYSYRVISGAAVFGNEHATLPKAKAYAQSVRACSGWPAPLEIERVQELAGGARRYWVQSHGRWVHWDASLGTAKERRAWRV